MNKNNYEDDPFTEKDLKAFEEFEESYALIKKKERLFMNMANKNSKEIKQMMKDLKAGKDIPDFDNMEEGSKNVEGSNVDVSEKVEGSNADGSEKDSEVKDSEVEGSEKDSELSVKDKKSEKLSYMDDSEIKESKMSKGTSRNFESDLFENSTDNKMRGNILQLDPGEEEALLKFKKFNERLDEICEEVEKELDVLLERIDIVDEELDENQKLIDEVEDKAKVLHKDLKDMNKDMKDVLEKMREPNKLCMDVCCLMICCIMLAMFCFVLKKFYELKAENDEILENEVKGQGARLLFNIQRRFFKNRRLI